MHFHFGSFLSLPVKHWVTHGPSQGNRIHLRWPLLSQVSLFLCLELVIWKVRGKDMLKEVLMASNLHMVLGQVGTCLLCGCSYPTRVEAPIHCI